MTYADFYEQNREDDENELAAQNRELYNLQQAALQVKKQYHQEIVKISISCILAGIFVIFQSLITILPELFRNTPEVSCLEAREMAIAIEGSSQDWVPLGNSDPVQRVCQINEFMEARYG